MKLNIIKSVIICTLISFLVGCASSKIYRHSLMADAQTEAYSTVYVFREDTFFGSGQATRVLINGEKLLELKRGTYAKVYLKPSTYNVEVDAATRVVGWATSRQEVKFTSNDTFFMLLKHGSNKKGMFFSPVFIHEKEAELLIKSYTLVR